jgi:DNA polymerase V
MPRNEEQQESVMKALDKLNRKYGDHTVFYAAAGMNESLKMMRRYKSPHYTTQWKELPVAQ